MDKTFEYYTETLEFHFKYAKGEPSVKQQEFHDYHEFVLFEEGSSYLISKNIQQQLACGSIVIIPKQHFHQFCISEPLSYVRCILGFRETPETSELIHEVMNEVKIIDCPDEKLLYLFKQLKEIIKGSLAANEKSLFVKSALIQLLIYLKKYNAESINKSINISSVVQNAINYIDKNYKSPLSVEIIAQKLYVSPSTLSHKFSKELNIPIYRYITKKRLSEAHKRIENGEAYTDAASKSGFSDYSCFYRLYKKYYTN